MIPTKENYQIPYYFSFAASLSVLSLLVALQIFRGSIYIESYSVDIFTPLEGVLHLQQGHRPHLDFSSPVGIFYLVPYYLVSLFTSVSGMTIVYANALVGAFAFFLATAVGIGRLAPVSAGLFSLYVGLVAISPRFLGFSLDHWIFDFTTYNAAYNRWGWSFYCILCLIVALPKARDVDARRHHFDAFITAFLLFVLFYLKITYFMAGVGLVVVSLVTIRRSQIVRYGAAVALALVLLFLLMELASHITVPYLDDLKSAAAAQPHRFRIASFFRILFATFYEDLLILLIGVGAAVLAGTIAVDAFRKAILLAALLGSGLAVATHNHFTYEVPIIPVVALIAFYLFFGSRADVERTRGWNLVLYCMVVLVFLKPMVMDIGSLLRVSFHAGARGPDVEWLRGTAFRDLEVGERHNSLRNGENKGPLCCANNDNEYLYVLSDGVELLRRHMSRPATVLPLTWSNPFPSLLGLPPVKHELLWWDAQRTFSASSHPNGRELLKEVDYVLIPKVEVPQGPGQLMREIYADNLRTAFVQIDESRYWTLVAKR